MPDPRAQNCPRHIPILKGDKLYLDALQAVRVSNDGVLGALVLENMELSKAISEAHKALEIFVYKFIDSEGNLIADKIAKKPKKVIKITFGHLRKAIDLFIFKQKLEG
jgi:hypothetical protein